MAPPTVSARCATGSAHHSWSRSSPDRQTSTPICYVRSACWRRRSIPCRTIVIVITLRTTSSSSSSAGGNTTQRGRRTTHQPQVCCLHIVCIVFFMSYISYKTTPPKTTDQLHPRILYETRDVIAYPLFLIFSKILETGRLPSDWKLAEVTTIYKKGPKYDRSNYRPVSLTSVCCKILESLIRDHYDE